MSADLYLNPVDFSRYQKENIFSRQSLGFQVQKVAVDRFLSGKRSVPRVALIGVPFEKGTLNKGTAKAPAAIRSQLYQLSCIEGALEIGDLGDVKPGRSARDLHFALRDVVEYLNEKEIVTVVLGGGQDLTAAMARAFSGSDDVSLAVVDPRLDVKGGREATSSSNFISRIVRENPSLFHLQMIGTQSPLVPPRFREELKKRGFSILSLGQLRSDLPALEPLIRDSSFLSFDISAVKHSDAPGHCAPSPNGLYGEEACQIARYAGLSTRLKLFGIFEVNPRFDKGDLTAKLAAQMVWYFLDAFSFRRKEDPQTGKDSFVQYYVELTDPGERILFYHHPPTNRWWIEIDGKGTPNRIAACRESDYREAVKREIPDIWWKYARKTGIR